MSIEDYITQETEASSLAVKVTCHIDIQGAADEIAAEVDDQLFHAVAERKGYVKERTCSYFWDDWRKVWLCSSCGHEPPEKTEYRPSDGYCHKCGSKVVDR